MCNGSKNSTYISKRENPEKSNLNSRLAPNQVVQIAENLLACV